MNQKSSCKTTDHPDLEFLQGFLRLN